MKITPEDMQQALKEFAFSMRKMAEEAGTDCDVPSCNALTLGVRCENCLRRLCTTHAFWRFGSKMTALCPYCVVAANTELFDDDDDDDDEDDDDDDDGAEGARGSRGRDGDVVDAEYEEL